MRRYYVNRRLARWALECFGRIQYAEWYGTADEVERLNGRLTRLHDLMTITSIRPSSNSEQIKDFLIKNGSVRASNKLLK